MNYLIKNTRIVNEGKIVEGDVLLRNGRIEKVGGTISSLNNCKEINGEGLYTMPGAIDDQVHFREPGLTHKASIYTESKAALAGGITSFMEMPNTVPPVFTEELLENKYQIASTSSLGNFSFYMGTSNDNIEEILKINKNKNNVCGVKIFMGSSTGNLLVENPLMLDRVFGESELLIATHCEDEQVIKNNYKVLKEAKKFLEPSAHPIIRNEEGCFLSSFKAIQYAKKYNSRLHILHISTAKELQLFSNMLPLKHKRITAEVCVHHLHFSANDYALLGNQIKCNPAIKPKENKAALWEALLDNRLDVIATDHAPHTLQEKGFKRNSNNELLEVYALEDEAYEKSHAGLPLVQHGLPLMMHYVKQGKISIEKVVEKMCHAVAICFQVKDRGFIREGYFADVVMIDPEKTFTARAGNVLYKCGWSPFENFEFPASIVKTFVNGNLVYDEGIFYESIKGNRLQFERE